MNHRVQVLELAGEQLLEVKIQLAPVLQNTVAKPGCQRCLSAVQSIPEGVGFENAVAPGAVLAAGDEHIQRSFPCAHNQASRG